MRNKKPSDKWFLCILHGYWLLHYYVIHNMKSTLPATVMYLSKKINELSA